MQQQATATDTVIEVWRRFLHAHCALTRTVDTELRSAHGLTINDFDVLVQLSHAENHRIRMSELADRVLLTRSGMTRLIDGLVRDGLVERVSCQADARVAYASLTADGDELLQQARATHHRTIMDSFAGCFTDEQLAQFYELLGNLPTSLPSCSCDAH